LKIRIKFEKNGSMKYIGHLDVMRYFQKVMRRADVNIAYSSGFSPHQIMSFASPLGLGITSSGEYMDIEVMSTDSSEIMVSKLNEVMVDGIRVLSYKLLPDDAKNAMSIIAGAEYSVKFNDKYFSFDSEEIKKDIEDFINKDTIEVIKKTKKSEKLVDIKPMIEDLSVTDEEIHMFLSAGSENNLKPELVIKAFCEYKGVEYNEFMHYIHRIDLYGKQDEKYISLNDYGEDI